MKIFVLALTLVGCQSAVKVRGGTTHTVGGEAKTKLEVVLTIDVSACKELEPEDQQECIKTIVQSLSDLTSTISEMREVIKDE